MDKITKTVRQTKNQTGKISTGPRPLRQGNARSDTRKLSDSTRPESSDGEIRRCRGTSETASGHQSCSSAGKEQGRGNASQAQ